MAVSSPMIYSSGEVIGVLRYVTSLRYADLQILLITAISIFVGVLFILFVVFGSNYFLRSILEPIAEITATAKRIAAGSYGSHIQKISKDEIGELAETINEMSDAISRTEQLQAELVSSVSHELRTPLDGYYRLGWKRFWADPNIAAKSLSAGWGSCSAEARG